MEQQQMERLYNEGRQMSAEKLGESHEYSQVCEGINNILKQSGRGYENACAVASVWHNELVFFHSKPDTTLPEILIQMTASLPEIARQARHITQTQPDIHYSVFSKVDDMQGIASGATFSVRTNDYIDREIKRSHPGTRRGSKRYRELASSVGNLARILIANHDRKEMESIRKDISLDITGYRNALRQRMAQMQKLMDKAGDIAVLNPSARETSDALGIINKAMDELKAKDARAQGILAGLPRTAWFDIQGKDDDKT